MGIPPKPFRDLLAEHVAERRAAYRAAANDRPVSDAELAALAAEASARAATPAATSGLTAITLPKAARRAAAADDRIENPKIQDADVGKYRAPNFAAPSWWKRANLAVAARKAGVGDVLELTLKNCCNALARRFNWGRGSARLSFETLAKDMGCCIETARKSIRYLQRHDVVNVLNTLTRDENNLLVRAPNLYLAPRPEHAPLEEASDVSPKLGQLARAGAIISRWASHFVGLIARDFGLNASPLRRGRRGIPEPS